MMFGNSKDGQGMMPGPGMASRMMQMMPMMAGQMLSECAGEDREDYLYDMVQQIVARVTQDMNDDDYNRVIETLTEKLKERTPGQSPSGGCC